MKCVACGKEVDYIKKSSLHKHIASPLHKKNVAHHVNDIVPLQSSMRNFLYEKEAQQQNKGIGTKMSLDTKEVRMRLCHALLSDGLSFKFLESKNPNG